MLYRILFEVILEEIADETSQMDYILYCTLLTIYQENEETWRSGNKDLNLAPKSQERHGMHRFAS